MSNELPRDVTATIEGEVDSPHIISHPFIFLSERPTHWHCPGPLVRYHVVSVETHIPRYHCQTDIIMGGFAVCVPTSMLFDTFRRNLWNKQVWI